MKKIFKKMVVLMLIAFVCSQLLLPLISVSNGAQEITYQRPKHGTLKEIYADLKPGETFEIKQTYKNYRAYYQATLEFQNIPKCVLEKYYSDGCLVETNKSRVYVKVSGKPDKRELGRKRHVISQHEIHNFEMFYNATVFVQLLYDTPLKISANKVNNNLPVLKIQNLKYLKKAVTLTLNSYSPLDDWNGQPDKYDVMITGKYYVQNNNSSSNKSYQNTSNTAQNIVSNVQNNYYTPTYDYNYNYDYDYSYEVPAEPAYVEKVINLTDEQKRLYIRTIYRRVLKRDPRGDEYDSAMNYTLREIASNVMLSPESNQKNNINSLSNQEFIKCCYRFLLGREADDGAKSHIQALNNSNNKVKAIRNFIESDEFYNKRNKTIKKIELNESVINAVYDNLTAQNVEVSKVDSKHLIMFEEAVPKITSLDISGKNVTDLTGISVFTNLNKLLAQGNKLTNISELEKMNKLTYLNLSNNNLGKNISPVWKLTNLAELYIDNTGITNSEFAGVTNLNKLQKLSVNKNKLTYLDPIKGITTLKELYVSNNNIDNLSGIKVEKFVADNQEIIISEDVNKSIVFNDKVLASRVRARLGSAVKSATPINGRWAITLSTADLYKVENLDLSPTANDSEEITDITGLEGFRNLKSLNLSNNKVTNLEKLSELPNLQTLIVRNNNLTNLNGLKEAKSLVQLDASTNLIYDVSGISNLNNLDIVILNNNKLGDNISSLNGLAGNLSTLAIDNNSVTDLSKIDKLGAESVYASYNYLSKIGNVENNTLTIKNNVLDIEVEGDECELPDIVKMAMANNGGLSCLELENCSIKDNKIIIKPLIRNAQIKIIKGNAKNTVVNIKNKKYITPPVVNIAYTKVAEGVKVTLTIDKPIFYLWAWKREDDTYMKYSKVFRYNVSNQKVVIKDGYGNSTDVNININDIVNDKVPGLTVKYSEINPTQNNVVVTISADVALKDPEKSGWKLSADKKSISCTFTENNQYGKNIFLATNPSDFTSADYDANVQINVDNIDKTAPNCTVEYSNTEKTNSLVVATIWSDEEIDLVNEAANLVTKTSKQNDKGRTIYGISLGYLKNTNETINVKDLAGNISPVSISVSNIDNILDGLNASTTGVTATNKDQTITVKANEKINLLKNANTTMADAENIFRRNKPWFAIAAISPVVYLAEGENGSVSSDNQIAVPATDAGYGALEISDEAGNTDLAVYNTNHIDKEAPIISVESQVKNDDGSVLVTLVSNEQIQNTVNQAGWTVSEDGLRLTKVFKSSRNETVVVRDLADNEGTLDLEVTGVSAIDYTVYYEPIENTDMVLVIISADRELKPVDGWELLEDKKSIAKAISVDHEETVLIEDNDGYGSEVYIAAYNSTDENKEAEDNTQAKEAIPQTGKYTLFAAVVSTILTILTIITLINYRKHLND